MNLFSRVLTFAGMVAVLVVGVSMSGTHRHSLVPPAHAQAACSVNTLFGAYGFYRTGQTPGGPLAAVGVATFNGLGDVLVRQTIEKNGVSTSDLFSTPATPGKYEIEPDCTGKFFAPDGTTTIAHVTVVDHGSEIFILSMSAGNTVYGVMRKIDANSERD